MQYRTVIAHNWLNEDDAINNSREAVVRANLGLIGDWKNVSQLANGAYAFQLEMEDTIQPNTYYWRGGFCEVLTVDGTSIFNQ